jgi:predicted transcriptional regulator
MESTNLEDSELYPERSAQERDRLRKQFREEANAAWEEYQATGLHLTGEEVDLWLSKLAAGEDAPMPECHT